MGRSSGFMDGKIYTRPTGQVQVAGIGTVRLRDVAFVAVPSGRVLIVGQPIDVQPDPSFDRRNSQSGRGKASQDRQKEKPTRKNSMAHRRGMAKAKKRPR